MARNNPASAIYDDSLAIGGVNLPTKISQVSTQDPNLTTQFRSQSSSRCGISVVLFSAEPWLVVSV
jgi:hypothetical protein